MFWFPPLSSPFFQQGRQLSVQTSSLLPSPSPASEVSSRSQAHFNFLEHVVITSPGQWEGLYIQSLEAPDGTQTQGHHRARPEEQGLARSLNIVKHHPYNYLKIINYLLSQELTSWCKFFKLWSPTIPASVYSQNSFCLTSLGPKAEGQEPGPLPPHLRQSVNTKYLVGTADGTGVAAAAAVKTGKSSGSEESRGEKELPEGKGAFDSHPCVGGGTHWKGGGPRSS